MMPCRDLHNLATRILIVKCASSCMVVSVELEVAERLVVSVLGHVFVDSSVKLHS